MGKLKYKKPRMSMMSTMPSIYPEREFVKAYNTMKEFPERMERGRELFLLEIVRIFREEIQKVAPKVKIGGADVDYAKDLKIAIVDGVEDEEAVAVYFDSTAAKMTVKRLADTVYFYRSQTGSPKWVNVLIKYGPWPANIVPVAVTKSDAKIIARKARPDEIRVFLDRIMDRREAIERELWNSGAWGASIEESTKGANVEVVEDVGYNVLRKEFGFDGEAQEAHWRPVLNAMKEETPIVMDKFIRYLLTGRESVFQLPDDYGEISKSQFKQGIKFQKELAPFIS